MVGWLRFRSFTLFLFTLLFLQVFSAAAESQGEFHARVISLYSFKPQDLNREEIKQKSNQLDRFWTLVKADSGIALPLLRNELRDTSNSAFFFYDGSRLLLSISKLHDDKLLALQSISKSDLVGLQHDDFLKFVKSFADEGLDTSDAAIRILDFDEFKAFITQHALTLGQDYALIYMLFPLSESVFTAALKNRLAIEQNEQSARSLLLALWYTVTPEGRSALMEYANSAGKPVDLRTYAKSLLNRKPSWFAYISLSSSNSLREQRRKVMQRPISDEALMEFDSLTEKLLVRKSNR